MKIDISVEISPNVPENIDAWQSEVTLRLDQETVCISCLHPETILYVTLDELQKAVDTLRRAVNSKRGTCQECPDCKAKLFFDFEGTIISSIHRT